MARPRNSSHTQRSRTLARFVIRPPASVPPTSPTTRARISTASTRGDHRRAARIAGGAPPRGPHPHVRIVTDAEARSRGSGGGGGAPDPLPPADSGGVRGRRAERRALLGTGG